MHVLSRFLALFCILVVRIRLDRVALAGGETGCFEESFSFDDYSFCSGQALWVLIQCCISMKGPFSAASRVEAGRLVCPQGLKPS